MMLMAVAAHLGCIKATTSKLLDFLVGAMSVSSRNGCLLSEGKESKQRPCGYHGHPAREGA
jgi:hypothetical protein